MVDGKAPFTITIYSFADAATSWTWKILPIPVFRPYCQKPSWELAQLLPRNMLSGSSYLWSVLFNLSMLRGFQQYRILCHPHRVRPNCSFGWGTQDDEDDSFDLHAHIVAYRASWVDLWNLSLKLYVQNEALPKDLHLFITGLLPPTSPPVYWHFPIYWVVQSGSAAKEFIVLWTFYDQHSSILSFHFSFWVCLPFPRSSYRNNAEQLPSIFGSILPSKSFDVWNCSTIF